MIDRKAFDQFAPEYDKWFEDHDREYALELRAIRELMPGEGTGIEIGAGTGRFTLPLNIALGVEPSAAMRRIAVGRGANVVDGTAEAIPVGSGSQDFALLVTTVCFLEAPAIAFREAYRVLKNGGSIIVGLIDRDSTLGRKYEERKNRSIFYRDATFHSVAEIEEKLEQAGFRDIECIQAILPGDANEGRGPDVRPGHGEGSFVVLRGRKPGA